MQDLPLRALLVAGLTTAVLYTSNSQEAEPRFLSLTTVGQAEIEPTMAEMTVVAEAEAELASEAWTSFRDQRRRALKTFSDLGLDGLTARGLGSQASYGPPIEETPQNMHTFQQWDMLQGVHVFELILVRVPLAGLDDESRGDLAARLIDTALDNGLVIIGGQQSPQHYQPRIRTFDYGANFPVRFVVPETEVLAAAARSDAMQRAREEAQVLASAQGLSLGRVSSVTTQPPQRVHTYRRPNQYYGSAPSGVPIEEIPSAGRLQVRATVRFELN